MEGLTMKNYIKENVSFVENSDNQYLLNVYEANSFIGCIPKSIYNILVLINGVGKNQAADLLSRHLELDKTTSVALYEKLIYSFENITSQEDTINELVYHKGAFEEINIHRIRSLWPKMLVISISRECFMKCSYCYAGAKFSDSGTSSGHYDIPISLIEKITKEAVSMGISRIELTGGDPYVRGDIEQIFDLFDECGITTSLSTKKLLTSNQIQNLKGRKCIDYVQISIDTLNDNIQENLIHESKYSSNRITLIKELLENGIAVRVNSVLAKSNIDLVFDLISTLDKIGVENIALSPYSNNLYRHSDDQFPTYDQLRNLSRKIERHCLKIKLDYPSFLHKFSEAKLYGSMNRIICSAGLDGLVVGPTGDAFICERMCYDQKYSLGSCKNNSLIEIWNCGSVDEYIKPNRERAYIQPCKW